jgi:hypothetical protein
MNPALLMRLQFIVYPYSEAKLSITLNLYLSLNATVAQSKNCPFGVNSTTGLTNITTSTVMPLAGYIVSNKCAGTIGCSYISFLPDRYINTKWQFLVWASIAFSELYVSYSLFV